MSFSQEDRDNADVVGVYTLGSETLNLPNFKGTITIKRIGPTMFAVGEMSGFPDGRTIKIGGDEGFSSPAQIYADEMLIILNGQLESVYEVKGSLEIVSSTVPPPPPPPKDIYYSYKSKILDSKTLSPISSVTVKDSYGKKVRSSGDGGFYLTSTYIPEEPLKLTLTREKYQTKEINIKKLDNTIYEQPVIKLESSMQGIEDEKMKSQNYTEEQLQQLKKEENKDFIKSTVDGMIKNIKTRLIPAIISQVSVFGITNLGDIILEKKKLTKEDIPQDLIKEKVLQKIQEQPITCPSNIEGLNEIINKKNKLTKQLNNLFNGIKGIEKFLSIPPKIISTAEKGIIAAKAVVTGTSFIPSTVTTPIPVGPILIAKDTIKMLEDLIDKNKGKLGSGGFQLSFVLEDFKKVFDYLDILDFLIQGCAEELGDTENLEDIQKSVDSELLKDTQQQSQQLSPLVTNVNGFEMFVISEKSNNPLKRKQAIAKNSEGVVMLKGELSYSSNEQILIDELVFYIQQNDLKA